MSVRTQPGCSKANKISSFWSSVAAHTVSMFRPHWEDAAAESQVRLKKKKKREKVPERLKRRWERCSATVAAQTGCTDLADTIGDCREGPVGLLGVLNRTQK